MIAVVDSERLGGLVLCLVAKRITLSSLLGDGYTLGQVMRLLLAARNQGYIVLHNDKARLTELGEKMIAELDIGRDKASWITPANDAKLVQMGVCEIFLPRDDLILD